MSESWPSREILAALERFRMLAIAFADDDGAQTMLTVIVVGVAVAAGLGAFALDTLRCAYEDGQ
jgi:hypothetical protein